jgi:hypothetical protein
MKYILRRITFDKVFKTIMIIFIGYFLLLLTSTLNQLRLNSDNGRYQQYGQTHYIIDTKTGIIKRPLQQ